MGLCSHGVVGRYPFCTRSFLESRPPDKAALYWRGRRSPLIYDRLARTSDLFGSTLSEELHYRALDQGIESLCE